MTDANCDKHFWLGGGGGLSSRQNIHVFKSEELLSYCKTLLVGTGGCFSFRRNISAFLLLTNYSIVSDKHS